MPDYKGNPTRVPASMVEDFLKAQELYKVNPPDPKETEKLAEEMLADLEARFGIKSPEEDLF